MPACEQTPLLGPYHDGELSADGRRDVEAHLAGCPACAGELDRLRAISARLAPVRRLALTDGQKKTLFQSAVAGEPAPILRLSGGTAKPRATSPVTVRWVRWLTAAAAAVFVVAAIQLFLHRGDDARPGTNPNENTTNWNDPANHLPGGQTVPPAPRRGTSSQPVPPGDGGPRQEAS